MLNYFFGNFFPVILATFSDILCLATSNDWELATLAVPVSAENNNSHKKKTPKFTRQIYYKFA